MKLSVIKSLLLTTLLMAFNGAVWANAQDELSQRLDKNQSFSADFSQTVTSPEGEVLMEGKGHAQIARPSLFRWQTSEPEESLLVSDGKTVWYYSPFVEQVTILNQEQATAQTPFVLLTRNFASDWANYTVTQQQDSFTLVPIASDTTVGTFQIDINAQGQVQAFQVIEQDGQRSRFTFSHFSRQTIDKSVFSFTMPQGVDVDDQRL